MSSGAEPLYGYVPSKTACYAFVALYSLSTLLHIVQAIKSRTWWIFPTVVAAGLVEVIGWSSRLISSNDLSSRNTFIVQETLLVLAPTPFVAALFVGFGRTTAHVGAQYSRLRPDLYSKVFLAGDITSLLIQGAGGGLAGTGTTPSAVRTGSNIILVGLGVQIASMSLFTLSMIEYAWRRAKKRPFRRDDSPIVPMNRHMKLLVTGICISTVCIYIRSIYRIVEFADGFNGPIAHNQQLFNVFDGVMVTLAMYTLNILNPGHLLQVSSMNTYSGTSSYEMEEGKQRTP